eukprot:252663-Amphidinium_carterae.7
MYSYCGPSVRDSFNNDERQKDLNQLLLRQLRGEQVDWDAYCQARFQVGHAANAFHNVRKGKDKGKPKGKEKGKDRPRIAIRTRQSA